MNWQHEKPTEPGFWYYQTPDLRNRWGDNAVVVVQVSRYKNRPGMSAESMESMGGTVREAPPFSGELEFVPAGWWAGPLPQPGDAPLRRMCMVPREVRSLFEFMASAFIPMTPQQAEIQIALDKAKAAYLAR